MFYITTHALLPHFSSIYCFVAFLSLAFFVINFSIFLLFLHFFHYFHFSVVHFSVNKPCLNLFSYFFLIIIISLENEICKFNLNYNIWQRHWPVKCTYKFLVLFYDVTIQCNDFHDAYMRLISDW